MIGSDMRLLTLFCLIGASLITSCSLLNKDKVGSSTADTTNLQDSIPTEYNLADSALATVDTIVTPQPPKTPLEYMSINEKAMIDEINLLRADPNAYIQYVDQYIQEFNADANFDTAMKRNEMQAVDELVAQLRYQSPLPTLEPNESLHLVAQRHGVDIKEQGVIAHRGSDGSTPLSRIQDSTSLTGAENLVAGGRSIRETVIMLLVDANDRMGRSHRKTLLNPAWKYVACNAVGKVGEQPNTWIQLFAYDDPNDKPIELPIRTKPTETKDEDTDRIESTDSDADNAVMADGDFSYMTAEEKAMIVEINLLRSNPKGYIKYVDEHVRNNQGGFGGFEPLEKAANELKQQLKDLAPLSVLQPHQKLYEVAKAHGLDNQRNNQLEHKGSDGRSSFDRVKDAGLRITINPDGTVPGNENLAAGEASIRGTVLNLLIDHNILSRGHRKALLEPSWAYVACYNIGTIKNLPDFGGDDGEHCWLQFFAPGDGNESNQPRPPATDNSNTEAPGTGDNNTESTSDNTETNNSSTGSNLATGDFSFMTEKEKAMIEEINLMRTNPKGYIPYVDAYVAEMKTMMIGSSRSLEKAAKELKKELNNISTLSRLQPHQKLYQVAKAHGLDNQRHNQLEHTGTDGRSSFDRVKDANLKISIKPDGSVAPNENLAGGESTVRNTVLALLIDDGIPTRGHRKALMEPSWKYVACYNIGTIKNLKDLGGTEDMGHCWVQFFAL